MMDLVTMRVSKWILMVFTCFYLGFSLGSQSEEKQILLSFKKGISKDPYGFFTSWKASDSSSCSWEGVSCDGSGNVEKIIIQGKNMSGIVSTDLSRLQNLRTLSLYDNNFSGLIPSHIGEIMTLWKLNLSNNAFSGAIPADLGNLSSLRMLDLSGNSLIGNIPTQLFKSCGKLRYISLSSNDLSGEIPSSMFQCEKLEGFDFSYNNLQGSFPMQLCLPPSMVHVSLKHNSFTGILPFDLPSCGKLQFLDLGFNLFTGALSVGLMDLPSLKILDLSNNSLSGSIPAVTKCSSLQELNLSSNNLTGVIPHSLRVCSRLKILDLRNNAISGNIVPEIGSLSQLSALRLGENLINGTIPNDIGKVELLQILDLHDLHLTGVIPSVLPNCRFLLEIDLSGNNFEGGIPEKIYNITYLTKLDVHSNRLNGSIPTGMGSLAHLKYLDLSNNTLSETIPSSSANMTRLRYFNVSFNRLQGPIPNNSVMQRFGSTSFVGNPALCGSPLNTTCNATAPAPSIHEIRKTKVLTVSAIIAIAAAAVIALGVIIITLINLRALRRKRTEAFVFESAPTSPDSHSIIGKLVLFSKSLPSKYEDWVIGNKALQDKDSLVGEGVIGTVYKATFDGGIAIAVKKLNTLGKIKAQEEFEQEIGRLGNLRHPNLVAFQGYYYSSTTQLILSEFISNGTLYHHLHESHPDHTSLCWGRRFKIALGTAKALAYLHHDCKPRVLHFDIKSTNILIDDDFEPKLSDYGLGKLLPMLDSYVSSRRFHRAVGYVAPEIASQSSSLSEKCDVYSFGVILLELVTGRRPVESFNSEVIILCDYVRSVVERGAEAGCIDPRLHRIPENEVMHALKLGLICTSETPTKRPSMAEVVQVLESINFTLEL